MILLLFIDAYKLNEVLWYPRYNLRFSVGIRCDRPTTANHHPSRSHRRGSWGRGRGGAHRLWELVTRRIDGRCAPRRSALSRRESVPTAKIPLLCARLGVGIRQLLWSRGASALKSRLARPSHSRTGEKAGRVEYPISRPSIEVPHSWVPTTFLASKDAWSVLDHGALLQSSEILGGGAIARNAKIAFGGQR